MNPFITAQVFWIFTKEAKVPRKFKFWAFWKPLSPWLGNRRKSLWKWVQSTSTQRPFRRQSSCSTSLFRVMGKQSFHHECGQWNIHLQWSSPCSNMFRIQDHSEHHCHRLVAQNDARNPHRLDPHQQRFTSSNSCCRLRGFDHFHGLRIHHWRSLHFKVKKLVLDLCDLWILMMKIFTISIFSYEINHLT